jgi:hypothetical protein
MTDHMHDTPQCHDTHSCLLASHNREHNENVEAKVMDVKCDLVVLLEHMGKHGEALPLHDEVFQKAWNVERWDHPFFHSHLHASKFWRLEHFLETQRLAANDQEKEARRREVESMGEKDGSYIRIQRPADDNVRTHAPTPTVLRSTAR